jgi:hypothetical protein
LRGVVHRFVRKTICVAIPLAADVLEPYVADLSHELARLHPERLQARVLDAVLTTHLLDEQLRVRSDV